MTGVHANVALMINSFEKTQTPILLFLYTPVKAQHTALIYELARLVSAHVYWSLIYGCQHSSFNVSWRHASLLWRWHVVSSLLLMEFGVTDLRGLWRHDCGIFPSASEKGGTLQPFVLGRHLKNDGYRHFSFLQSKRCDPLRETGGIGDVCNSNLTLPHAEQGGRNACLIIKGNRSDGKGHQFHPCGQEVGVQTLI